VPEVPGIVGYQPSAINLTVGGTSFSVTAGSNPGSVGDYIVVLADPSTGYGGYVPELAANVGTGVFVPVYGTTTPALDISNPSATVFSIYKGSYASSLTFSTVGGNLTLAYDNVVGVNTSITAAVPEPEEWAMMLVGSGLISWQLRRRAKAAA
jgi:hypothetical protein